MDTPHATPSMEMPIELSRFTQEEITWLAAESSRTSKSTAEVAKDLIRRAAAAAGFKPSAAGFTPTPAQPA